MRTLTVLLGMMLALQCATEVKEMPKQTYTNPVIPAMRGGAGADPAVFYHDGTYYFLSSNGRKCIFSSPDLVHWEPGPQVLPDMEKGIWAPEMYYHPENGKFYIYYTNYYKIGVAVANRPDTMFTDLGYLAIPGIDAHPFRDDDGRLYLYFTFTPSFDMYCIPMKSPTETGGPVTECFKSKTHPWEREAGTGVNEGPWMEKRHGKYTMMYSAPDYQYKFYAIGLALAPTPIGPFTKYEGNPVFRDLPKISGPGHGSVAMDRAGQLWHVYHQKVDTGRGGQRDICIDKLNYDEEGILRGTPTRGVAMEAPNCDTNLVWCPEFTPRGAIFNDQVTVSIHCRTKDAEIHYTLDGSEPTEKSPHFTQPFTVATECQVKARAYKKGMITSTVAEEYFTKTGGGLAPNPSPDAPAGDPPFDVFEKPVKDGWRKMVKKS